jgi:protein-disulfide isomerase
MPQPQSNYGQQGYYWTQPDYRQNGGYQPYSPGNAAVRGSSTPVVLALAFIGLALVAVLVLGGGLMFATLSSSGGATSVDPVTANMGDVVAPDSVTPANIPSDGRTLGNASAPVTVDVWLDYQCPGCADFHEESLPHIVNMYVSTGKVRIVSHNDIVINTGGRDSESLDAANAAECAADQGLYWTYSDWLFANQGYEGGGGFAKPRLLEIGRRAGLDMDKFGSCVSDGTHDDEVQAEASSAPDNLDSVPAVFVEGRLVPNYDYSTVSMAIDAALANH